MHCIYEADTALDAQMVRNLLEQQGISTRLDGEYLPGASGELPAGGLVRVMVSADDIERARQIVDEWETKTDVPVRTERSYGNRASAAVTGFFLGVVTGAGLYAWASYHGPAQDAASNGQQPCTDGWYTPEPGNGELH